MKSRTLLICALCYVISLRCFCHCSSLILIMMAVAKIVGEYGLLVSSAASFIHSCAPACEATASCWSHLHPPLSSPGPRILTLDPHPKNPQACKAFVGTGCGRLAIHSGVAALLNSMSHSHHPFTFGRLVRESSVCKMCTHMLLTCAAAFGKSPVSCLLLESKL